MRTLQAPQKKRKRVSVTPLLNTSEQVRHSIERDQALTVKAQREQAQNEAEAGRISNRRKQFELRRDKIVFAFECLVAAVLLVGLISLVFKHTDSIPISLLSGGGAGGIGWFIRHRRERE